MIEFHRQWTCLLKKKKDYFLEIESPWAIGPAEGWAGIFSHLAIPKEYAQWGHAKTNPPPISSAMGVSQGPD